MLHADGDLVVDTERAKEADNVGRSAFVKNFQLSHDLVPHSRLDVQHYHLHRGTQFLIHGNTTVS